MNKNKSASEIKMDLMREHGVPLGEEKGMFYDFPLWTKALGALAFFIGLVSLFISF